MEEVDVDAAPHLAAARDRDLADLGVKVDANRSAINALGVQTAAGFEETRRGFAEMRDKFDQLAAGSSTSPTCSPPSSPPKASTATGSRRGPSRRP